MPTPSLGRDNLKMVACKGGFAEEDANFLTCIAGPIKTSTMNLQLVYLVLVNAKLFKLTSSKSGSCEHGRDHSGGDSAAFSTSRTKGLLRANC